MSREMIAVLVFGGLALFALLMFVMERRAVARRKAERGGREVDVADLIAFGSAAGKGEVTHR